MIDEKWTGSDEIWIYGSSSDDCVTHGFSIGAIWNEIGGFWNESETCEKQRSSDAIWIESATCEMPSGT